MNVMTTGRSTSSHTVERVELREYYRWIGYDLDLRLHRMLHLDGFKVALDGWAASILLRCDSAAVSPVRRIIEGRRIDVTKLNVETIFLPDSNDHDGGIHQNFSNTVESYWNRLCSNAGHVPSIDTLEYSIDYSRQQTVLLKLDRPLACPAQHVNHFDVDDYVEIAYPEDQPEPGIGEDPRYLAEIPRGSTFFASRFQSLRPLAQAHKELDQESQPLDHRTREHRRIQHRMRMIEEQMYRILLQMVLYHVKLLAPRGGHEVLSNDQTHRRRRIEDLSSHSGFGLEVHEKNRQFMQENEAKFEGWFEGAAYYCLVGSSHQGRAEREELVQAMRYESPSHRYAVDKIAELERLLPPGPLSPEDRQDRSNRIYHLLLQNCRTIVRRSDRLRLMFNDIISSVEAKQKNNKYTAILRQWEQEFYERIEVEGSLGWNYLHEANFELIVQELERCCNNRYHITKLKLMFCLDVQNVPSRPDQWQTLSEDEIEVVVSGIVRDPGVPPLEEVQTPAPPYTARSLAQRRRISRRQAKLRQDLRTFGAADHGGLLI
ncbi:hypothetical protein JCM5353_000478 [Sporobolomyces roseus]